jgi:hypothetical protein
MPLAADILGVSAGCQKKKSAEQSQFHGELLGKRLDHYCNILVKELTISIAPPTSSGFFGP